MLSGLVACALFFNMRFLTDHFGAIVPQHVAQIAFTYFGLAILFAARSRSPLWSVTGIVIVIWAILMDWLYAPFLIPLLVISLFVCGIHSSRRGRILLAALALVGFGLVYASGVFDAYRGFTIMSVRLWGRSMYEELSTTLVVFGGQVSPFAPTFRIFAVAAVLYHLVVRRKHFGPLAALTALCVAALAVVDLDVSGPHVHWTLPTINYFERPLIPLYGIMVVSAVSDILAVAWRTLHTKVSGRSWRWQSLPERARAVMASGSGFQTTAAIILSVPLALVLVIGTPGSSSWNSKVRLLPARWDLAENFAKELGLPPAHSHEFSPYFYDATSGYKIYNCRHLTSLSYEIFNRYCGYMLNLFWTKAFVEFQNSLDLQNGRRTITRAS